MVERLFSAFTGDMRHLDTTSIIMPRHDIVLTWGSLIHPVDGDLELVMQKMIENARRYIIMLEFFSPETRTIPWRGRDKVLFARDFGGIIRKVLEKLPPTV